MTVRRAALSLLLTVPSYAVAHQERLVLATDAGRRTLRLEADDGAGSLRLRVLPQDSGCAVSRETVQRLLAEAFRADPPKLFRFERGASGGDPTR